MARKKLTMDHFEKARLDKQSQKKVRGGYKYGPSGAGYVGSYIWESIDIRGNQEGDRNTREVSTRRR
ncbi:MAG: hypothetical protein KDD19_04550 [Phaeodactylibacter sp.]|nr:hypothetical protein [Phaeodactylibacter sp.]MCB9052769.1 hypothetical protein [Lewinellaceae bacterium]